MKLFRKLFKGFSFDIPFFNIFRKRWFSTVNYIPKRIRIVTAVIVVTGVILFITFLPFTENWILYGILLAIVSYLMTYFAIFENINRVEWYMLFIGPVLLTLSLYLFFSLFPVRWLTRLPFLAIFGMGYYAMLLISNIFNIGVDKSLQLYRAAFTINFLLQSFLVLILTTVILSFKSYFILKGLAIFIITFLLSIELFWSVNPRTTFDKNLLKFSAILGLLMAEWIMLLSFIPIRPNVEALVVTASYYSMTGIMYHYLDQRLFKNIIREYSFVFIFVCFIALLTLQW